MGMLTVPAPLQTCWKAAADDPRTARPRPPRQTCPDRPGQPLMTDTTRLTNAQASTIVVTLPGEIDAANATGVADQLNAALDAGATIVIADMTGTRFCDSSGIHAVVMAHQRATAAGTSFRIAVRPGEVRQIMNILRLDTVLALYPRLDIALLDGEHNPRQ